MSEWIWYERKGEIQARDYIPGEDLTAVSVSREDIPQLGGKIARNPDNPDDQWYISAAYFAKNYQQSQWKG